MGVLVNYIFLHADAGLIVMQVSTLCYNDFAGKSQLKLINKI